MSQHERHEKVHKIRQKCGGGLKNPQKVRKAFSLVELVIAILIIAVLVAAVFAGGSIIIKNAQISRTTSDLHNFSIAVESWMNENPSIANVANNASYKTDTPLYNAFNALLAEDYKLEAVGEGNSNIAIEQGTEDTGDYYLYKSMKTDAWGNPYYIVLTNQERNTTDDETHSEFFVEVISAGPNAKTKIGGEEDAIDDDDIFLLAQMTDSAVTSVIYNCSEGTSDTSKMATVNASTPTKATQYVHTSGNAPVIFGLSGFSALGASSVPTVPAEPLKTFTVSSKIAEVVSGSKTGTLAGASIADTKDGYTGETESGDFTFVKGFDSDAYDYTVTIGDGINTVPCNVSPSGIITVNGETLQVFEDGAQLTIKVKKKIAGLTVHAYHLVNDIVLIAAYDKNNDVLDFYDSNHYSSGPTYLDERFNKIPEYAGKHVNVVAIDVSFLKSNYGFTPLKYKTRNPEDIANILSEIEEIVAPFYHISADSSHVGTFSMDDFDINRSNKLDINDYLIISNILKGTYSYAANPENGGRLSASVEQYILSDATFTSSTHTSAGKSDNTSLLRTEENVNVFDAWALYWAVYGEGTIDTSPTCDHLALDFDINLDGEHIIYMHPEEEITVTLTLHRTDATDAYKLNSIQTNIQYDSDFFYTTRKGSRKAISQIAFPENLGAPSIKGYGQNKSFSSQDTVLMTFTLKAKSGLTEGTRTTIDFSNIIAALGGGKDAEITTQPLTVIIGEAP